MISVQFKKWQLRQIFCQKPYDINDQNKISTRNRGNRLKKKKN